MHDSATPQIKTIVSRFEIPGDFVSATPYGTGHINDTYASCIRQGGREVRYIHQRINQRVFKKPEQVMENIRRVTEHLRRKIEAAGGDPSRETLTLVPARTGKWCWIDDSGDYWRTYVFIEGARTYDLVENRQHVRNASRAFGEFQKRLSDLPGSRLHETIPDFHNTRRRFEAFCQVLQSDPMNRAADVRAEIEFVLKREPDAGILVDALAAGRIPERITHNDTKFNNVMVDDRTGEGICVIDLDTVMPGLAMYDFGDAVRITANPAAEDEPDLSKVRFDLGMFECLAEGYMQAAGGFLAPEEVDLLAFSAKLMTFECGMRFLADYIAGDVYYKVHRERHNIDRCRTQFAMVAGMEGSMEEMKTAVDRHRAATGVCRPSAAAQRKR